MSSGVPTATHHVLNALDLSGARAALLRCCGSQRWVDRMLSCRPFASTDALLRAADEVWQRLDEADQLEAFAHHPQIGEDAQTLARRFGTTAALAAKEQSGVRAATGETLAALRAGNLAYAARFGFVFLVCASGKSADDMLGLLQQRLPNDRATELRLAAAEQAKITRLRLLELGT